MFKTTKVREKIQPIGISVTHSEKLARSLWLLLHIAREGGRQFGEDNDHCQKRKCRFQKCNTISNPTFTIKNYPMWNLTLIRHGPSPNDTNINLYTYGDTKRITFRNYWDRQKAVLGSHWPRAKTRGTHVASCSWSGGEMGWPQWNPSSILPLSGKRPSRQGYR